ncbi:E3 ubiquitin-protein ligase RNF4-like isoform X1 [Carex littledalei]|uniref:E3 ubiquitin-protein ligase RNF4-like isoform X1 n=1 Tax=Carex littledalei TaxID=544730 RepID=A0A833R714_9POAL|nr:E3 ubiquitin-protein ligase RNF4-like isoform X1 [Carex littledalei]
MPRENSNCSRSTASSGNGRGRRRVQPVEVEPPFIDVDAIDVDDDDDDVIIVSPSRTRAPASNVSRRRPVVLLDDDVVEEVNPRPSGVAIEEEVSIVSGNNHNKRVRISPSAGGSAYQLVPRTKVIEIQPEPPQPVPVEVPPPPPPKEPTFSCPICLNQLTEPCSTTCGHVFCQSCIKASIQAQKKCPTCRKKLNKNSFHRLYLPNTVN